MCCWGVDPGWSVAWKPLASAIGLGVLALLLSGCGSARLVASLQSGSASAVQAAQQNINKGIAPAVLGTFRVLGTRTVEGKVVVFYTLRRTDRGSVPAMRWFGAVNVNQVGRHWVSNGHNEIARPAAPSARQLVDYEILGIEKGGSDVPSYMAVFGYVLPAGQRASVAAIDVTMTNGQTLHDTVQGGAFAVATLQMVTVCSVWVRVAHGRVLHWYDAAPNGYRPPPGCRGR
jgi:hypothetical protein